MRRRLISMVLTFLSLSLSGAHPLRSQDATEAPVDRRPYDWLFVGGKVLDGSGNPWYPADVGVRGGRIADIGVLRGKRARRTVDITGRLIVPGFIDLHSHADGPQGSRGLRSPEASRRAAPNLVTQGVTTVVVNQDGRSDWPISEQRTQLANLGTGPNVILLAGHGTIRTQVMGEDVQRAATDAEIEQMRALLRQALLDGALGLSAGVEYVPGRWSETEELVALVHEIVPYQGVYISHQRSEGADPMWFWPSRDAPGAPNLLDAVRETIEIGGRTGATVVASHIKAKGANYWGTSLAAIQLIERARMQGVDVWADQYPYDTTGSDGNTVLIPPWVFRKGPSGDSGEPDRGAEEGWSLSGSLRSVLEDPGRNAGLRRDIAHEISRRGGARKIVVFEFPESDWVGRTLFELSEMRQTDPVDMAIQLQLEGFPDVRGGARLRGFSLSLDDIRRYATMPWTATSSDAGIALPEDGFVHARFYGTFTRKIRHYALDTKAISLEQAIRSSTSLPAQILRLKSRGTVREGSAADLVVLDLERIEDKSTFFDPHQHSNGIDYVLVNGNAVVENGHLTGALPGVVISQQNR